MADIEPLPEDIGNMNEFNKIVIQNDPATAIEEANKIMENRQGGKFLPPEVVNGDMIVNGEIGDKGIVKDYVSKTTVIKNIAIDIASDEAKYNPDDLKKQVNNLAGEITDAYGFKEGVADPKVRNNIIDQVSGGLMDSLNIVESEEVAKADNSVNSAKNKLNVTTLPTVSDLPERPPTTPEDVKRGLENKALKNIVDKLDPKGVLQGKIDKVLNDPTLNDETRKAAYENAIDEATQKGKENATTEDKRSRIEWLGDQLKSSWDIISSLGKLGAVIFLIVFSVEFINNYCKERSGCFVEIKDPKTNSVIQTYKIVGLSCGDYRRSGKYYQDYGTKYQQECIHQGTGTTPTPPKNPSGCGSCDQEITKSDECPCGFKDSQAPNPYASTFCDDSFLISSDPSHTHHYFKRYCTFQDGVADMVDLMFGFINDIANSDGPIGDLIRTLLNLVKYGAIIAVVFVFIYAIFYFLQRFNIIGGGGGRGDGTPVIVEVGDHHERKEEVERKEQAPTAERPSAGGPAAGGPDGGLSEKQKFEDDQGELDPEKLVNAALQGEELSDVAGITRRVGGTREKRKPVVAPSAPPASSQSASSGADAPRASSEQGAQQGAQQGDPKKNKIDEQKQEETIRQNSPGGGAAQPASSSPAPEDTSKRKRDKEIQREKLRQFLISSQKSPSGPVSSSSPPTTPASPHLIMPPATPYPSSKKQTTTLVDEQKQEASPKTIMQQDAADAAQARAQQTSPGGVGGGPAQPASSSSSTTPSGQTTPPGSGLSSREAIERGATGLTLTRASSVERLDHSLQEVEPDKNATTDDLLLFRPRARKSLKMRRARK